MKLKTLILSSITAGSLIMGSSVFAGLEIQNKSTIPNANIYVSCTNGIQNHAAIFDMDISWSVVESIFLGGNASSVCTFTDNTNGKQLAQGQITISSDKTTGTVSGRSIDPNITIKPANATGTDIVMSLSGTE